MVSGDASGALPTDSPNAAQRVRALLARSPALRRSYHRLRASGLGRRVSARLGPSKAPGSFWELAPNEAIRMAYNVMLRREPDPVGLAYFEARVASGEINYDRMVEELRGSEEFACQVTFSSLGHSIHTGRCEFIRSLPSARRILDLGGTHKASEYGAFVRMGYLYPFDELVIVDLPSEDRHPIYQDELMSQRVANDAAAHQVMSPLGLVSYRYHSMTDLSDYPDASFDLVYMGQSIEHVTESDGDKVLAQVHRVLRPGGWLALDTPNGRVTRVQQDDFIDPDHEIEYTVEQLDAKLQAAGFTVVEAKGLNYAGRSLERGVFSVEEVAGNTGIFADARECYILTFLCSK
jgi:predicted SAM-dependent methyltransferase